MTTSKTPPHHAAEGSGSLAAADAARWSAEWEGSPTLQAEYPTAGSYIATMKRVPSNAGTTGEASRRALVAAKPAGPDADAALKAAWAASPKLQEEYPTAASYVAIKKREAR